MMKLWSLSQPFLAQTLALAEVIIRKVTGNRQVPYNGTFGTSPREVLQSKIDPIAIDVIERGLN